MKFFSSLFGRNAKKQPMDFESIKSEVEHILQIDLTTEEAREANRDIVSDVILHLETEIENVSREANNYPNNSISALVWVNGSSYAKLALALTHHFRSAGWLIHEQNASLLWTKATLAVCSHHHHLVGPAMIANADCHDRLGNTARAIQMYVSIVKDFSFFAGDYLNDSQALSDEDLIALESLQTATEYLLSHGLQEVDGIDLPVLQANISDIISSSELNEGDQ